MTKAEIERIRKLEAQVESLRKLPKFTLEDWGKIWEKLSEFGERLGLLEKTHNDLVSAIGLNAILTTPKDTAYVTHLATLRVEEKT